MRAHLGHRSILGAVTLASASSLAGCPRSSAPAARSPEARDLYSTEIGDVREIQFDDGAKQTIVRRTATGFEVFEHAREPTADRRCSPNARFEEAFAGIASLHVPAEPSHVGDDGGFLAIHRATLRILDAVTNEPAEWPVVADPGSPGRLLVLEEGGISALDLEPAVVRRIVLGCAAFE